MSVVYQLKNLFSRKPAEPSVDPSDELSLGTPDASLDPMATRSMEGNQTTAMTPLQGSGNDAENIDGDSVELTLRLLLLHLEAFDLKAVSGDFLFRLALLLLKRVALAH